MTLASETQLEKVGARLESAEIGFSRECETPQREVDEYRTVQWILNGELHNLNGHAREWVDGTREWWVKGKLHRLNGPAREYADGDGEWWVNNVITKDPRLCDKAARFSLTDEEFQMLCSHEDYVVRQIAAHNPHCPTEWRTLVALTD